MAGVEPAMVGVAETVEGSDVDQGCDLGRLGMASSVSDVTVTRRLPEVEQLVARAPARGIRHISDGSRSSKGGCRMCRNPTASTQRDTFEKSRRAIGESRSQ